MKRLVSLLIFAICAMTASAADITEEVVYAHRDSLDIYGLMYKPAGQTNLPIVICSHSSSLTHKAMEGYAQKIAQHGYAAYCFDFCGGSSESLSGGSTDSMTVFTEVEDLKSVVAMVKTLDYVDTTKIVLLGSSQGGLVSALVADEFPEKVKGMILLYPAFNIAELVQLFYEECPLPIQNAFSKSLKGYQVYDHIGTFPGDVLILHGTMDFIVPASYSEKAEKMYEHCELHLIEGANHGFNAENYGVGDYDEVSWNYIAQYLQSHMTNTAQSEAHATD